MEKMEKEKKIVQKWNVKSYRRIFIFIITSLLFFLTALKCGEGDNQDDIDTSHLKVPAKCFESDSVNFCSFENEGIIYYFDKNNKLLKLRDADGIEYQFYQGDINRISKVSIPDENFSIVATKKFNINANGPSRIEYIDSLNNEMVWKDIFNNGHKVQYKIFRHIPDPINRPVVVSHFTIEGKDTTDYFYYRRNGSAFVLYTNALEFDYKQIAMDSIILTYTDDIDDVSYYSPKEHTYIVDLENTKNTVLSMRELPFKIPTSSDKIVGTLWSFLKKDNRISYGYHLIYFQGDIMNRIKENDSKYVYLNDLKSEMSLNKKLFKSILRTGEYSFIDGKLIKN